MLCAIDIDNITQWKQIAPQYQYWIFITYLNLDFFIPYSLLNFGCLKLVCKLGFGFL